jgi:hypothetical protein
VEISQKARRLLLCGLIECLPEEGVWTRDEREDWLQLLYFLIEWLFEMVEEEV